MEGLLLTRLTNIEKALASKPSFIIIDAFDGYSRNPKLLEQFAEVLAVTSVPIGLHFRVRAMDYQQLVSNINDPNTWPKKDTDAYFKHASWALGTCGLKNISFLIIAGQAEPDLQPGATWLYRSQQHVINLITDEWKKPRWPEFYHPYLANRVWDKLGTGIIYEANEQDVCVRQLLANPDEFEMFGLPDRHGCFVRYADGPGADAEGIGASKKYRYFGDLKAYLHWTPPVVADVPVPPVEPGTSYSLPYDPAVAEKLQHIVDLAYREWTK